MVYCLPGNGMSKLTRRRVSWLAPANQPSATSPPSSARSRCSTRSPTAASSGRTRSRAAPGINASTVSRLLATLASARFVEHVPETGRYRLVAAARRARQRRARPPRPARARPAAPRRRSSRETGETATLSAPGEHDAVTVDFAHSSSVVQSVAQLGRPSVGHATAAGKVMLAFGDVELPAEPLAAFTPRTITTRERARRGARRGCGGAASPRRREEREEDLAAVAAPVRDSRGELVGIVGVQGPASRFDARAARRRHVPLLLDHASDRARLAELGRGAAVARLSRAARRGTPPARGSASSASRSVRRLQPLAVRADDEQARARSATSSSSASIGRGLQSRSRSTSTASDVRERGRRAQRLLDLVRADVLVPHRERDRPERHLGGVDDDQRLARLDGRVDGERRRLGLERDVERDEHHRVARRTTRADGARGSSPMPPSDAHHSGRSCQLGVCVRTWSDARRRSGGTTISANAISSRNSRNANRMSTRTPSGIRIAASASGGHEHQQAVAAHVPEQRVVLLPRDLPRVPRLAARRARPALAVGEARGRPAVAGDGDRRLAHRARFYSSAPLDCLALGQLPFDALGIVRDEWYVRARAAAAQAEAARRTEGGTWR